MNDRNFELGKVRGRRRKKAKRKYKVLSRALALIIICLMFFGVGKALGNVIQAVTKTESPYKSTQVALENNTENQVIKKDDVPQTNSDSQNDQGESNKKESESNVNTHTDASNSKINKEDSSKEEQRKMNISASNKSDWNLILVNPWNKLSDNFSVERTTLKNGHSIDKRAYPDLQKMMDAARAEGLSPIICSSFRTMDKQRTLFSRQVNKYISLGYSRVNAEKEAAKWVAIPGTSEHQTGLAVDIVASSYQLLDKKQESTAEQKWLMKNSYKYGFILRYPSDKSRITGIGYEPWHYRYVGKEAAKEIYEKRLCLEEYLGK